MKFTDAFLGLLNLFVVCASIYGLKNALGYDVY